MFQRILLSVCIVVFMPFSGSTASLYGHAFKAGRAEHAGITIIAELQKAPALPVLHICGLVLLLTVFSIFFAFGRRHKVFFLVPVMAAFCFIAGADFGLSGLHTLTTADGSWTIPDISNGYYRIRFTAPNYYPQILNNFPANPEENRVPDIYLQAIPGTDPAPDPTPTQPESTPVPVMDNPTRLARGPDGRIFVTDARRGSVTIYDDNLQQRHAITGILNPLGIAVGADGWVYIGSRGKHSVEVFSPEYMYSHSIGQGELQMPSDIELDMEGNIYVADSASNAVRSYFSTGEARYTLVRPGTGSDNFQFPSCVVVGYFNSHQYRSGRLFIGDQGRGMIHVFDLSGTYIRSFGEPTSAFSENSSGKFARLQSLALNTSGQLYAVDDYLNLIEVFNAWDGTFLYSFGQFGTGPGDLNLPLDILWNADGTILVSNAGNQRLDIIPDTFRKVKGGVR